MPYLPLCHWSSQLFDLRAPSSTDVPVLLLNQPIETKRAAGYSLRAPVSALAIAHRGPVLWNALIFKDKYFLTISYKDLKRKTHSMDIFKELTFKETATTTTNFRR